MGLPPRWRWREIERQVFDGLDFDEQRATVALIECLEEVQERRLYTELGYASLWEFATRELGLSEGAAQRRIQAMRLTRAVPQAKAAIESGALSLSNAAKLQSFARAETKQGRKPDSAKLVETMQGLSQRECEAKLLEISPEAMPKEKERVVSANADRELKLVVIAELYEKLQRLKGLLAHAKPDASYAELLEFMLDETLSRIEKKKGTTLSVEAAIAAAAAVEARHPKPAGRRVYLPVAIRRAVWARSGGRCEIIAQGRRCTSGHRLEVDHATPLALGGSNELNNLRLVCKNHNLERAGAKNLARPQKRGSGAETRAA